MSNCEVFNLQLICIERAVEGLLLLRSGHDWQVQRHGLVCNTLLRIGCAAQP